MLRNTPHSTGSQTSQKPEVRSFRKPENSLQQTKLRAAGRPDTGKDQYQKKGKWKYAIHKQKIRAK